MKALSKSISLLAAFLIFVSACSPAPGILAQSSVNRETNPRVSPDNLAALVKGNNAFALDLFHVLNQQDGNLVLSPYSISLALAMTFAGARSRTESQMAAALHYTLPPDQLHPSFNQLDLDLQQAGRSPSSDLQPLQLNVANGVWVQQGHPFQPEYLDLIGRNYSAGIHSADFVSHAETARNEINDWTSNQTQGKIRELVPQGALDGPTRMVLINAIYFKADWQDQFDPNSTQAADFNLLDGTRVQAKMMSVTLNSVLYARENGMQAIELPYQGGTASMDIFVPDPGNFNNFETALDSQKLDKVLGRLQASSVSLGLPKFTYAGQLSLAEKLKTLGMIDAFDSKGADFSGMDGALDLYIGAVIHRAYVAVDEKGTEAAAASAVIMESSAAPLQQPIHLEIDRPFVFLIRDTHTRQILFIGKVLNPLQ
jgi:serpin B